MQKIIFLDIDGPVIPQSVYFIDPMASLERTVMSTVAIGWLNHLCQRAGASIVTNTYHNGINTSEGKNVRESLIQHGLKEEHFHLHWHTTYPIRKFSGSANTRLDGIEKWQKDHGEADWICFDDEYFTEDPRLILIDFAEGITIKHFEAAANHWDLKDPPIFLF